MEVPREIIASNGRSGSARIVDGLSPVNGVITHSAIPSLLKRHHKISLVKRTHLY